MCYTSVCIEWSAKITITNTVAILDNYSLHCSECRKCIAHFCGLACCTERAVMSYDYAYMCVREAVVMDNDSRSYNPGQLK